ncbi:MAG TPA: tetratricopeptide repeat protein [Spirochaetota bacterium]|nr:tetratricopeptide repeat protein [Spirochaetota bacterium]
MTLLRYFIAVLFIAFPAFVNAARLSVDDSDKNVFMFFTEEEKIGVNAVLRGKVLEFGVKEDLDQNERELGKSVQERTKVTVRLISEEGIVPGSVLYIVNERNLVVAKMHVIKVYDSRSFYRVCVGYGNFRAAKRDFRVVQKNDDAEAGNSYLYVSKGNYYKEMGDISKAIEFFQKAH